MEGLSQLSIQADVVGDADWRELVGLDREAVKKLAAEQLADMPGLTLVEKSPNAPRLVVNVVGHVIADDEGRKATAATHIWVRLSQRVAVHRDGMDEPVVTTGATWQRAILSTGLKRTMRQRANNKLKYLLDQFGQDYVRVNPPQ
jgi:hypothetical protein